MLETVWQAEASGDREEVANSAPSKGAIRQITARLSSPLAVVELSGTVFEDANYGGGPGRPLATNGASPLAVATVELYNTPVPSSVLPAPTAADFTLSAYSLTILTRFG